jgi:methylglutaconyl-CoA hydratase
MSVLITPPDARGIATLTLDRPQRHNAFDDTLLGDLTAALQTLAADAALRVLVLAANGRSFSAGADLDWMRRTAAYGHAENLADAQALAQLMHRLDRFPRPTIARVQGSAVGGGVGLVACCDIAVCAPEATFCLSEVRLGLIPAVISPYVIRAIGARQARRYFLTAEPFTAARAHAIGLVHEVVAADALDDAIDRLTAALREGAPDAQCEAKDLLFLCDGQAIDAALIASTAHRIADRRASPEGQHGLHAFLTKTTPNWRQG